MDTQDISRPRLSEEDWLAAAYEVLTESGVEAVKVMPLAKRLGVSRTSFYWHFKDREELLEAMVQRWEERNTGNLVARTEAYAESIAEAMFNLFDCWIDPELFDSRLDLAIRNWARNDSRLQERLDLADARRERAMTDMFLRFGYPEADALIRARAMIYTQIGYISMQVHESTEYRISLMPGWIKVFTGTRPEQRELDRFLARHR
ncbi:MULTISPECIES: TetR/AcrR family transcriptional regulator [unclassified Leisingera]|uniref:TetR/AcrR family transcriptional regulator n=1 Tax=unclassified Leisingera TaxID=2614906 RepID=UPI0003197654|nr:MULTISPECIES: TetR/AcrR family transcriptional regulator [unclassified Leisingera]KIC21217.1 TetR family transcriptional regulator [Leisingera sp. ANG-S3]KIC23922.1 TetR family transcriptional regulator [Leisingera sp. ANG-M6]KIC29218.1 TetR family transcriptional regulator [Leisingera sp. ANG-S5]KIC52288.1 TetR family transcriptional regulator [Leisingera sp. ANG-S]KID08752.1 TetR family transcriptional regulator [Leisingera sp. ANG1]